MKCGSLGGTLFVTMLSVSPLTSEAFVTVRLLRMPCEYVALIGMLYVPLSVPPARVNMGAVIGQAVFCVPA